MTPAIVITIIVIGLLFPNRISVLQKRVELLESRLNELAKLTGNSAFSSQLVPDDIRELTLQLKQEGKKVAAVKKIRENTSLSLMEAKQYVDDLN